MRRRSAIASDGRSALLDRRHGGGSGSQETIREHTLRARQATAFVSIMQGCNMHCTFCIVPRTRGAERSRTIAEIVTRSARTRRARSEGSDAPGPDREPLRAARVSRSVDGKSPFVQLLEAVHDVDGLERLRFTSPHPIGFRADLIAALRATCRNFASMCICRCNPAPTGF